MNRDRQRKVLIQFATLLGSVSVEHSTEERINGLSDQENQVKELIEAISNESNKALESLMEPDGGIAIFPSLDLNHHHHYNNDDLTRKTRPQECQSREEIENDAASNLSREILVSISPRPAMNDSSDLNEEESHSLASIPSKMHHNFFESFALLIDSRIHALRRMLLRHSQIVRETALHCRESESEDSEDEYVKNYTSSSIFNKVLMLDEIHANFSVDAIVTRFHVLPSSSVEEEINDGNYDVRLPISFEMVLDLAIYPGSKPKTICMKTPGYIKGSFGTSSLLSKVSVDIDAHELLKNIVHHAGKVVMEALERMNQLVQNQSARRRSLTIKPVLQDTSDSDMVSTDDKSKTMKNKRTYTIISPEINPRESHNYHQIDDLSDGNQDSDIDDDFSPPINDIDQVIDSILIHKVNSFCDEISNKRIKTS
eukprot:CAMPEP_0178968764 /NCGR_PEP_ID=MMETSP0789-20121207/18450_1 /TAXON_ID=3005 /ORGANISM="Rhizosolenia setigera, Strain CCMP 1694" /LENGTH=426 /DNA_ID=CAMNT_0020654759 /DNA_START=285 /DNA_END=1565 /DNA_ORIENTATION=+